MTDAPRMQTSPRRAENVVSPFMSFRESADSDDDDDDDNLEELIEIDEAPMTVWKHLVYGENIAYAQLRLSDGSSHMATEYVDGEDGFIVAKFENGETLSIEVPNKYRIKDHTFVHRLVPAKPAAPKRKVEWSDLISIIFVFSNCYLIFVDL